MFSPMRLPWHNSVGINLLVTNVNSSRKGIAQGCGNSILISRSIRLVLLTETLDAIDGTSSWIHQRQWSPLR